MLLNAILAANVGFGESRDERFITGLLARRLFSLAERHCLDQLDVEGLTPRRRAELVVELSRTYAQRALNSAPGQRAQSWDKARGAVDDYLNTKPSGAEVFLARRQQALVPLARGELARHESEVVTEDKRLLETARLQLRLAVSMLAKLESDLDAALLQRARGRGTQQAGLTAEQLRILKQDIRYQLARTLSNQALCYAPASPDRTNSLTRAAGVFRELSGISDPIDWKSRVHLLACYRELQEPSAFQRWTSELLRLKPPADVRARINMEQARALLDRGQPGMAYALFEKRPAMTPAVSAEWDYLHLVATLSVAKQEQGEQQAKQWQDRAVALVRQIESNHGPYWMRRAEGLMGRHVAAAPATGDVAILARAAASFYRAGKLADAVAAYDRARAAADSTADDDDASFELGYKAASIQHQQRQYADARDRFRKLALRFPENHRAPQAHLLAIYNSAQLARSNSPPNLDEYVELLGEHTDRWKGAQTVDQAHLWLARVYKSRRQWDEAVTALRAIRAISAHYAEAVSTAAICYRQLLGALGPHHTDYQKVADQAADFFASVSAALKDDQKRQPLARTAELESARFRLYFARHKFSESEQALRGSLAARPDAPVEWKTAMQTALVYALAGQPDDSEEAKTQLAGLGDAATPDLLQLVTGLARLLQTASPESRGPLAALQQQAAGMLSARRQGLDEKSRLELDRSLAEAYVAAGRRNEARDVYAKLADENPSNAAVQVAYARLLLAGEDQESWRNALERWRQIEKKSRPKSDRWFAAKYSQALAHQRLGNPQQAARVIKLTQILHAELGGPEMKARFLDLLQKCEPPR